MYYFVLHAVVDYDKKKKTMVFKSSVIFIKVWLLYWLINENFSYFTMPVKYFIELPKTQIKKWFLSVATSGNQRTWNIIPNIFDWT